MLVKNHSIKMLTLNCTILVTVLSQIEPISKAVRPMMYALWFVLFGLTIVWSWKRLYISSFTKLFCACYFVFGAIFVAAAIINPKYLSGNYLRLPLIPLIVTIVGDSYSTFMTDDDIQQCLKVYISAALIYAVWVQRTYYPSYTDWLQYWIYAFDEKNSAAQIWSAAIGGVVFLLHYKNMFQRIFWGMIGLFLFIMCGISQCRTALLGIAVVAMAFAVIRAKNKLRMVVLLILLAVVAWIVPFTRAFIEQALFLKKYVGADMNKISSGRLDIIVKMFNAFLGSPLFGIGRIYGDCSYLCVLAETGVVGFILIETIWGAGIIRNLSFQGFSKARDFLFAMTIFYFIESLLEAYPPFGPGVSSFLFWFLSAILINKYGESVSITN